MSREQMKDIIISGIQKNRFLYLDYGRYGLMVEPSKDTDIDRINNIIYFFISVPSSSELKNDAGEEMAGETLAKAYASNLRSRYAEDVKDLQITSNVNPHVELIEEAVNRSIKVKFKIRDEHWTRHKEELATAVIMSALIQKGMKKE